MPQRRHHYECAFEAYLRDHRIAYVSVDEARRAMLPAGSPPNLSSPALALKSFDFVLYGPATNWLVDVKGRKVSLRAGSGSPELTTLTPGRLESWATRDDVDSLQRWLELFGEGFQAAFLFVYWCEAQPPAGLFQDVTEYQGRWYALRSIALADYAAAMKTRSQRWRTVDLPTAQFERLSQPFATGWAGGGSAFQVARLSRAES